MAIECEAKIRVPELAAVARKLESQGAVNEGAALERNWVLDHPDDSLHAQGILLRIRTLDGVGGILTVKHRVDGGAFKTREEVESMADSAHDLLRQMEIIGFRIKWIYEKMRATWLWHDCVFALDDCPEIGSFVEIEGEPKQIRAAALKLGLNPDDHIDDNYLGLWQKHLAELGEPPRNMVFQANDPRTTRRSGRFTTRMRKAQS